MKRQSCALGRVRKLFPQVTKVVDSTESINICVTPEDSKSGRRKDFANCALAKACKRTKIAEATIIGIGYSYLINGDVATRYKTSTAVGREITSFDRHHDFAAGINYKLSKVSEAHKLGRAKGEEPEYRDRSKYKSLKQTIHRTAFVRKLTSI